MIIEQTLLWTYLQNRHKSAMNSFPVISSVTHPCTSPEEIKICKLNQADLEETYEGHTTSLSNTVWQWILKKEEKT